MQLRDGIVFFPTGSADEDKLQNYFIILRDTAGYLRTRPQPSGTIELFQRVMTGHGDQCYGMLPSRSSRPGDSKLFAKNARFGDMKICVGRPFSLTFLEPLTFNY